MIGVTKVRDGLLFGLFLFFFVHELSARPKPIFGPKAGFHFSKVYGDLGDRYAFRFSYHLGVYFTSQLNEWVDLQPELLYCDLGANNKDPYSATLTLRYLSLPVLIKIHPNRKTNLHAGPYVNYLLSGERELEENAIDQSKIEKTSLNNFDIGIAVGGEYVFKKRYTAGARANFGFVNLNSNDEISPGAEGFYQNNEWFQLYVCYRL